VKKANVRYDELPESFRPQWARVLIDDTDLTGTIGGKAWFSKHAEFPEPPLLVLVVEHLELEALTIVSCGHRKH